MQNPKFQEYLQKRIGEIDNKISLLRRQIIKLENSEININDYGSLKELRLKYHEYQKYPFFPLSPKQLSRIIKNEKIIELKSAIKKLQILQRQISSYITQGNLLNSENSQMLAREYLIFASRQNLPPRLAIKNLITIYQSIPYDTKNINNVIGIDFTSFLVEPSKIDNHTLIFIFNKLIKTLFTPEELNSLSIYIETLRQEIITINTQDSKNIQLQELQELQFQKRALQELSKYVINDEIINTPHNLETFQRILNDCHLPESEKERLLQKMRGEMNQRFFTQYLTKDEYEDLLYAEKIIPTLPRPIGKLLKRAVLDIKSECHNLDMISPSFEFHTSYDVIETRITRLQTILNALNSDKSTSYFHYLVDSTGTPEIIYHLDSMDISNYDLLLDLLTQVKEGLISPKSIKEKCGFPLKTFEKGNLEIIYTELKGQKICLKMGLKESVPFVKIISDSEDLKRRIIKTLEQSNDQAEFLYEEIILATLDLKGTTYPNTLNKKPPQK